MKILSAAQMKAWDVFTIQSQRISSWQLMERAATAVADAIDNHRQLLDKNVFIFCGSGNNGGDGLAVGRILFERGRNVHVVISTPEIRTSADFEINFEKIQALPIPITVFGVDEFPEIDFSNSFILDAIFGIGYNKPMPAAIEECISKINQSACPIVSIDLPSGLFMSKSTALAVKANWVITFQTPKLPLLFPQNHEFVQKISIVDIGLERSFEITTPSLGVYITKDFIQSIYKPLQKYAHKGTQGHVCLIGGSFGKMGAVVLAAKAALKSGCGLVTAYIPKAGVTIMQTAVPEVMTLNDNEDTHISFINLPFIPSSIGIGIGLGVLGDTINAFSDWLKNVKSPTVFDADAINILAQNQHFIRLLPSKSILTPHPKELQRLIGAWSDDFVKIEKVKSFAKEYDLIVLVKGPHSIITDGTEVYFNSTGNPSMATAGLGDTLTGVITSLLAQHYTPLQAAIFGVYIHGWAADLATQDMGKESFTATDMWYYLGKVFKKLNELEF